MLNVTLIPCYSDNYAYLLSTPGSDEVALVDGCEAAPIVAALGGRRLTAILATHHHPDHVGGNLELLEHFPAVAIYGHATELSDGRRIPGQTIGVADGEAGSILGRRFLALHVPGHTLTAVAFYFPDDGLVFTGDTMFGAGCGRLFEGTPLQLHTSLTRLAQLPPSTQVYSGHEYLARNLQFARQVEPTNVATQQREQDCLSRREQGLPCEPSTIATELATSPFLRCDVSSVQAAVATRPTELQAELSTVEVFARLRRWRNSF